MYLIPFGGLKSDRSVVRDPLFSLFDEFLSNTDSSSLRVNYASNDTGFVFTIPVPGAEPKDVDVEVNNGMIFVKAKIAGDEGEHSFGTSFTIPDDADTERIEASVRNGLLKIRVDRQEASKPRKVAVH